MSDNPGPTVHERFRDLHREGTFLMANVADMATARALAVAACIRRLAATEAAGAGIEDWSGDPERGFATGRFTPSSGTERAHHPRSRGRGTQFWAWWPRVRGGSARHSDCDILSGVRADGLTLEP